MVWIYRNRYDYLEPSSPHETSKDVDSNRFFPRHPKSARFLRVLICDHLEEWCFDQLRDDVPKHGHHMSIRLIESAFFPRHAESARFLRVLICDPLEEWCFDQVRDDVPKHGHHMSIRLIESALSYA